MQVSGKEAVTRDRVLGFAGSPNFRDAGGYVAGGGSVLHWGRIYRSGHLADLGPEEMERLQALRIDLVCDLRRDDERRGEPSRLPPGVRVVSANITPGSQTSAIYADPGRLRDARSMYEFMCDINRQFVLSQSDSYRAIFATLLDSGARRVLFHCSAGKDRTGFAVAVLHLALGVAREDIEYDYVLSKHYYRPAEQLPRVRAKYPVAHLADEDLLPMMVTDVDYLSAALTAMEEEFGAVDCYLEQALGLGQAERRELGRRFLGS